MTQPPSFQRVAETVLRTALGADAHFRPQQLDAIQHLVVDRGRLLVVQRTGWGKSAVYFVATRLLRDQGAGPTIIISPLLALMRDQIAMAGRLGLRAKTINSSNTPEWEEVESALLGGAIDVLLISPERLNNPDFRQRLLRPLADAAGLLVVDEAHCISDWGHDFRPDYRRLTRVLEIMPPAVPILCTTATANDRVIGDINQQLGADLRTLRGTLDRESLALHVIVLDSRAERLAWLAENIPTMIGSGIVYCLTVNDCLRVADWLVFKGIAAAPYSGETDPEVRIQVEQQLKANVLKVVVATSALGMGFDKPDLGFVIHYQSPDSPVGYYQQVGRAGRAIDVAEAVLLVGLEDADIWKFFLETSLPLQADAEEVVRVLAAAADWTQLDELQAKINLRQSRIEGLLKILEVENAVERQARSWRRTLTPWRFDSERVERVRQARLAEQRAMREYAELDTCRMAFLRKVLDDDGVSPCGRCDACHGGSFEPQAPRDLVVEALNFVRRRPMELEPRKRWPGGSLSGLIPQAERLELGRALCSFGDPGWGREVRAAKLDNAYFSDALVRAAADLIVNWGPQPVPAYIAYIPVREADRDWVPDLAARLGAELRLPVREVVRRTRKTLPQKTMQNSIQQLRNIHGAFRAQGVPAGAPLLLVDDVSDSRWTMTYVGHLLRRAGAGPIHPFVLAGQKG